jgi:hypothetical protein
MYMSWVDICLTLSPYLIKFVSDVKHGNFNSMHSNDDTFHMVQYLSSNQKACFVAQIRHDYTLPQFIINST